MSPKKVRKYHEKYQFLGFKNVCKWFKSLYKCQALSMFVNKKNKTKKKQLKSGTPQGLTNHLGVDQMLVLRVCCIQLYKISSAVMYAILCS